MSGILGALGIPESSADRLFVNTIGQSVVYDAVQRELTMHNEDLQAALEFFLETTTTDHKQRYKLPGGGYLQERGAYSPTAAVKAAGAWDVGYPLKDYGAQIASDDIAIAYMTLAELNRHIDTVTIQDKNTVRYEMLRALLDNATYSFLDENYGTLPVVPLANGDSQTYPAILGSDLEATQNHFVPTGYASSSISATNNPCITVRDLLEQNFGAPTGGSDVILLVPQGVGADIEKLLPSFDPVVNRFINPSITKDIPIGIPPNMPGRVLGISNSVWVTEWRWLPANYAVALYMTAPKPIMQRVDPPDVGLGQGLMLVARDQDHPFNMAYYRHRFGFGVGNRLNGVVLQFTTSGSYSVSSGFSRS